jgi:polysaccharide biosynthesis/export protein
MRWVLAMMMGVLLGWVLFTAARADEATPNNVASDPPRKVNPVLLPSYRVEARDVLHLGMVEMTPLAPYHIGVHDVLTIRVTGTLPDNPIDGLYLVEAKGIVTLGPVYGRVSVQKATAPEVEKIIAKELRKVLKAPKVSVHVARRSGDAPITGVYPIGPKGTINLRKYGALKVTGKTTAEIRAELNKHLSKYLDSPDASVDVCQFNSKAYYLITEGAGLGDQVRRVPITGNVTVLEALSAVTGLTQVSNELVWVARPTPGGPAGSEQILPVDYAAITHGASPATNYQLMPGDRVFVSEKGLSQPSKSGRGELGREHNRIRF